MESTPRAKSDGQKAERGPATDRVASGPEIESAINGLTDHDSRRLLRFAAFRWRAIGRQAAGMSPEDLIAEAFLRVLKGNRRWKPERCSFLLFLKGCVRSISSHLRDGRPGDLLDDPHTNQADEDSMETFERLPASSSPDREAEAQSLDAMVREKFGDDAEVELIYECLLQDLRPARIRDSLGLTKLQYNAAVKRLRRGVLSLKERREA